MNKTLIAIIIGIIIAVSVAGWSMKIYDILSTSNEKTSAVFIPSDRFEIVYMQSGKGIYVKILKDTTTGKQYLQSSNGSFTSM